MANCFAPIPEKFRPKVVPYAEQNPIREVWNLIPKAKKVVDADGVSQDVIDYVPQKIKDIPIDEYIASFAEEVGIQNILRKVAMTGDRSYLNQTSREALCPEGGKEPIQDYTDAPSSKTEAFNLVAAGVAAYDKLPEELKGKMSMEQFVNDFSNDAFNAYVQKLIEANKPEGEDK